MATATTLVPLETYLDTAYRPDCDWIDGELRERNMGEKPHGALQGYLCQYFRNHQTELGIMVYPEQRVQTSEQHYRIADVCVTWDTDPDEPIVRTPPLLCVEILSRRDTLSDMQDRVDDYKAMGVQQVWVIDPLRRKVYIASNRGFLQPEENILTVEGTAISIPLDEMFASLVPRG